MTEKKLTNKLFASEDQIFRKACEIVDLTPTTRQASKYRLRKGLARTAFLKARREWAKTQGKVVTAQM